jgi:L-cysteine:1D-myo-inositol 2-amino-2-deoxy-alpha-D-glucopyranoside ligase
MIGLDGEKMSKSLGNLVFVSKLVAAGRNPMAIRWALMKSHYRQDRMWSEEILVEAEKDIAQLNAVLSSGSCGSTDQLIQGIISAIADDLDTPKALSLINSWVNATTNQQATNDTEDLLKVLDAVLGLKL